MIAYGSEVEPVPPGETLRRLGLEPGGYVLFVGRLVPENCAHHLVEAFAGLDTGMRCVVVGDAPYAEAYKARLRGLAARDPRVVMPGYVFGEGYRELGTHAAVFVETSGVGGTHPALVEAMHLGSCPIVNDTDENLETVGGAGLSYDGSAGADALRPLLADLLRDPPAMERWGRAAAARARRVYSWDRVTDEYEALFRRVLASDG